MATNEHQRGINQPDPEETIPTTEVTQITTRRTVHKGTSDEVAERYLANGWELRSRTPSSLYLAHTRMPGEVIVVKR